MPCIARDKSGTFFVVTSSNGKRVWRSTHTKNRREAERVLRSFVNSPSPAESRALSWAVKEYLNHIKAEFRPKTYKLYDLIMRNFVAFTGDVPLDSVTSYTLDQYKAHRLPAVSASTVNVEIRTIRAFFNCLSRWKIVTGNPCTGVATVRVTDRAPAYLSPEDLRAFIASINDIWLRRIVRFTSMTGLRIGEVLNLHWQDVNLERRSIVVRSSESHQVKGGKSRKVPLNEAALGVLTELLERDGIVFAGKHGGAANTNHVSGLFRKYARRAGLDHRIHFHSLRHTFASLLVQNGISLYQVQKLLGHSSARVTEVYAHLENAEMHDVVDTIDLLGAKDPEVKGKKPGAARSGRPAQDTLVAAHGLKMERVWISTPTPSSGPKGLRLVHFSTQGN